MPKTRPKTRIVYCAFPNGKPTGGQKMILRHVETLRDLGFDAVLRINPDNRIPEAFRHRAPVEVGTTLTEDEVVVLPDDGPTALRIAGGAGFRTVVFVQNHLDFAATGLKSLAAFAPERFPAFISVSPTVARMLGRAFPDARVEQIPAFVDERLFRPPSEPKRHAIVTVPRKRKHERYAIDGLLGAYHPRHAATPWLIVENATEDEVARAFATASVCLSLSRMEALGLTPLEAMACGCLVTGFTGLGGQDFATPQNGAWVPEDDCEAAADALAETLDLALSGGPACEARRDAGYATAAHWTYARFREALEDVWMRLAPEARISSRPLPPP